MRVVLSALPAAVQAVRRRVRYLFMGVQVCDILDSLEYDPRGRQRQ